MFCNYIMPSLVVQSTRNPPAYAGDLGSIPGCGKIPWRRKWQPTPVFLPGESHGRRSLVGYSPRGRKESDTIELLHFHFHTPNILVSNWGVSLGHILLLCSFFSCFCCCRNYVLGVLCVFDVNFRVLIHPIEAPPEWWRFSLWLEWGGVNTWG